MSESVSVYQVAAAINFSRLLLLSSDRGTGAGGAGVGIAGGVWITGAMLGTGICASIADLDIIPGGGGAVVIIKTSICQNLRHCLNQAQMVVCKQTLSLRHGRVSCLSESSRSRSQPTRTKCRQEFYPAELWFLALSSSGDF